MLYFIIFILTFLLSAVLTWLTIKIAWKLNILDYPTSERKIHKKPIPLLGGVAVFLSFTIILVILTFASNYILGGFIDLKNIIGILLAGLIIIIGGILEDKYKLIPRQQIIFPIIAAIIIVAAGIGISSIRNPFGGLISFNNWQYILFWYQGIPYKLTLMADLFTFIWLMGMMYTTKLLDGLDGLVSGVTVIGSLIICAVALSIKIDQTNTALIALILAGAFAGFLVFNFNPAKIFLGESGSLFAGLMLGVLAIISGSKVATALLIMGIPILDVVWVIARRLFSKNKIVNADRKHLHHRLLDIGLSQRQAVLLLYLITIIFGSFTLFFETFGKLLVLIALAVFMIILAIILVRLYQKREEQKI
ncbi:MAG: MraY family glycosyltransferase [Candidatus Parcubacteria bacterium]|nr:MraY family glycosyltransferase [Candidatus Parcubacteria bacterium]